MTQTLKLPKKFLLASLQWRGLKISPVQLFQTYYLCPDEVELSDFKSLMAEQHSLPLQMSERWFAASAQEWLWMEQNNLKFSTLFDPDFPVALRNFANAPTIVTYWGQLTQADSPCISIVGTRHPSRYSLDWMDSELDAFFKEKKNVVAISGGAHGVDQKAHFLAIRNGRATICLLPSGLAQIYPRDLMNARSQVVHTGGAMVSTLSPFAKMEKRFFLERNRYIANWSPMTFVVEAKRRSGTMITARWVKMLDRQLTVLPCSPLVPGLGGLDLIIDGGALGIRDRFDLGQAYEASLLTRARLEQHDEVNKHLR